MRLLTLTAVATLVIIGSATAGASARTKHHHYREANAAVADDAAPADTLNAHDAHIKNLHDAGYNSRNDFDAHGNIKTN